MNEAEKVFSRFPSFVKDFIARQGWDSLRDIQLAAAKSIFETENNLLLTSSTASGKTEAAFFPVLATLCEDMPSSVGVLYIAPLKSLINDQFSRIDELLDECGLPVYHWHGDVSASHKNKLLKTPSGILQITPESLESMLMNRSNDLVRLFCDLRFIIIDEVHTLIGSDRGNQIICQLCRLSHIIGHSPRRIGLSATIGDTNATARWLCGGSGRDCDIPEIPRQKLMWRLGMEHFYVQNADDGDERIAEKEVCAESAAENSPEEKSADADTADTENLPEEKNEGENITDKKYVPIDAGYEFLYDCVSEKKSLVFSNSREETEYVTATLRQIAKRRGDDDIFLIHHGNLSAALREEAEIKMKEDIPCVTCATVTMELGIDIGKLERIAQLDSPTSVSSFLQRLGRSGRRGAPPEMMMVFREENPLPDTPLPQLIPWGLIRAVAIVQLYIEDRFIEPPRIKTMPMSLLFQQTLSILASCGELTPKMLCERVLTLPPFEKISQEDYKILLASMLNMSFIEKTEEGGFIIGLTGERLINSFKFYATFKDSEDFTVRCESNEIGTITTPPPVGDRFALAGRVWEVLELDVTRKLIYVKGVEGKMEIAWPGDYGEVHTRILERMRRVLCEDSVYPYLKENAKRRLDIARHVARNTGMTENSLIHTGGISYCLFPWLGTVDFRTLRRIIAKNAKKYGVSDLEHEGCYYMTFKLARENRQEFMKLLCGDIARGIDKSSLVGAGEHPAFDKYDNCIPSELLRRAFCADRLSADAVVRRAAEMLAEYPKV